MHFKFQQSKYIKNSSLEVLFFSPQFLKNYFWMIVLKWNKNVKLVLIYSQMLKTVYFLKEVWSSPMVIWLHVEAIYLTKFQNCWLLLYSSSSFKTSG